MGDRHCFTTDRYQITVKDLSLANNLGVVARKLSYLNLKRKKREREMSKKSFKNQEKGKLRKFAIKLKNYYYYLSASSLPASFIALCKKRNNICQGE